MCIRDRCVYSRTPLTHLPLKCVTNSSLCNFFAFSSLTNEYSCLSLSQTVVIGIPSKSYKSQMACIKPLLVVVILLCFSVSETLVLVLISWVCTRTNCIIVTGQSSSTKIRRHLAQNIHFQDKVRKERVTVLVYLMLVGTIKCR